MRVQVLPQFALAGGLDPYLNRPWPQAPALLADKHGVVRRVGQRPQRQPKLQGFAGLSAYRQHAGFAALAEYLHQSVRQVQLVQVQAGQFRQAQARGIEQLQDRLVAVGEEVVFHGAVEQLQGAVGVQGLGQAPFALRRRQAVGRVVIAQAFAVEVVIEPAHSRQQARQAARGLAGVVQACDQAAQVLDIQGLPTGDLLFFAVGQDLVQVPSVGFQRMGRHLALVAQVSAVSVQLPFHG
ncbi:hypothetical protein PS687_05769 [Pseudomonas fluorescens]|nr:hypothetical protein PS687_05769 [Pseudomonas fluorescens]